MALHHEAPAVLLIHWRRHRFLLPQVSALRRAGVTRFYIACDGPRAPSDEAVIATQDAIVDLKDTLALEGFEIQTRISPHNLGCERGVLNAIDWFFEQENDGIILEDDCSPGADFVPFMAEMLHRYRGNPSVFSVSGENSTGLGFKDSYGFVAHPFIWGWATWRDRWEAYSGDHRELASWRHNRHDEDEVERLFPNRMMRTVWTKRLDRLLFESLPDTWDYQLTYYCRNMKLLCIVPAENLVKNLGAEADGTHITGPTSRTGYSIGRVFPLRHPKSMRRSARNEFLFFWRDEGARKAVKLLTQGFRSRGSAPLALQGFSAAVGATLFSGALRTLRQIRDAL